MLFSLSMSDKGYMAHYGGPKGTGDPNFQGVMAAVCYLRAELQLVFVPAAVGFLYRSSN